MSPCQSRRRRPYLNVAVVQDDGELLLLVRDNVPPHTFDLVVAGTVSPDLPLYNNGVSIHIMAVGLSTTVTQMYNHLS